MAIYFRATYIKEYNNQMHYTAQEIKFTCKSFSGLDSGYILFLARFLFFFLTNDYFLSLLHLNACFDSCRVLWGAINSDMFLLPKINHCAEVFRTFCYKAQSLQK